MKGKFLLLAILFWNCSSEPIYNFVQQGKTSYYGKNFKGRKTASGEPYHPDSLTAAHRYLPLGTIVQVTNLSNQKKVFVRINDRGPFVKGRILDLSHSAADSLAFISKGLATVEVKATLPQELADSLRQLLPNTVK